MQVVAIHSWSTLAYTYNSMECNTPSVSTTVMEGDLGYNKLWITLDILVFFKDLDWDQGVTLNATSKLMSANDICKHQSYKIITVNKSNDLSSLP